VPRRLLAAAVLLQPLLVAVNAAFHPDVEMNAASFLEAAEEGPTRWYVVHVIAALGGLLLVPAALGLRTLVRDRGSRLADAGVVVSLIAAPLLALTFAMEASTMRSIALADVDEAAALAVSDVFVGSPEYYAVAAGILAFVVTGVLLAAALIRARTVPWWQPALYGAGILATLPAPPGTAAAPVAFAVVTLAAAFLAARVLAASDA
jgi:hypothetical protein